MARAATTPSVPVSKRSRAGSAPARGKPYHHGNLREALVSCGKVQLAEVGLADISLRRIAAGVGVSQVAPKHHFGNKEGLLAAIAADGFRDLAAFRASRLRNVEGAEESLRALLSSYVAFAGKHPALFALMFSPQFRAPAEHGAMAEAAGQAYMALREAAARFIAELPARKESAAKATKKGAKVAAPEPLSADEVARSAWASMHGIAMLLMDGQVAPRGAGRVSRDRLATRTLDIFLAGVRSLGARTGA